MKRKDIEKQDKIIEQSKNEYINILEYLKRHFYYYGSNKSISIDKLIENTNNSKEKVLEIYNLLKVNNKDIKINRKNEFKLTYSDILFIDQILKQSYNSKLSIVSTFIALFLILIPACEDLTMLIPSYFDINGILRIIIEMSFSIINIFIYFKILNILDFKNKIYFNSPIIKKNKK